MEVKRILPEELEKSMENNEKLVVLDVRAAEKYMDYHIQDAKINSLNINKNEIFALEGNEAATIEALPKDQQLIVTCTTGNSAGKCAGILAGKGYDVVVLDGGVTAWKEYLKKER